MVNFSDVVTYDGISASVMAQPVVEELEPTPEKRTWEIWLNAITELADQYGVERDDFVGGVLAQAMPTLLQCKTSLNDGPMDLVKQGIWGGRFRGQSTVGVRTAARNMARGNSDEWLLEDWPADDAGQPLGILDGLTEGLNLWDSATAATLEFAAQFEIDRAIARAQSLEKWAHESDRDVMTVAQELRAHADHIKACLDEMLNTVPEPGDPGPLFIMEPQRTSPCGRIKQATKLAAWRALNRLLEKLPEAQPFRRTLYRVLVRGGEFREDETHIEKAVRKWRKWGKKKWRIDHIIPSPVEAVSGSRQAAGFEGITDEALAIQHEIEVASDRNDHVPVYLAPEYPFERYQVEWASRVLLNSGTADKLAGIAERVAGLLFELRQMLARARAADFGPGRDALWDEFKMLTLEYQAERERGVEEISASIAAWLPADISLLSPTELAAMAYSVSAELNVKNAFGLLREGLTEGLELDIEDPDVWNRLHPEGPFVGESLLPDTDESALDAVLELVTERVPPTDLTWDYWDSEIARKAHVTAALHRTGWQRCAKAGREAYWSLIPSARREMYQPHDEALREQGFARRKIGGRWVTVSEWGDTVTRERLELVQAHIDALKEDKQHTRYVLPVLEITPKGIGDSNGRFLSWRKLEKQLKADRVELQFINAAHEESARRQLRARPQAQRVLELLPPAG